MVEIAIFHVTNNLSDHVPVTVANQTNVLHAVCLLTCCVLVDASCPSEFVPFCCLHVQFSKQAACLAAGSYDKNNLSFDLLSIVNIRVTALSRAENVL